MPAQSSITLNQLLDESEKADRIMTQITIALTKGRILKETLPLLASAGIVPLEDVFSSRKLVFATNCHNVRVIILRGSDVATYVQFGAADLGVQARICCLNTKAMATTSRWTWVSHAAN